MHPYIPALEGRAPVAPVRRVLPSTGIARHLGAFVVGSIAQGASFVLVAAALERRGSGAVWLAAIAAARLAPYLVCSPVAGALAGRYPAKSLFTVTAFARCAVIVALWIALSLRSPAALLVVLLFALVAAGTPTFPALMRAVHHAVPPARLDRSTALAAGLESAAFGAGPAVGGLLLMTGSAGALLVCAAMMAASAGAACSLPRPGWDAAAIGGRSGRTVGDAARCLLQPAIRPAVVAVLGVNVLAGISAALLVRLPAGLELGGERAFGVLSFVEGLGMCGAFAVLVSPIGRRRRPLAPVIAAGAAFGALAGANALPGAMVACSVLGASILTAEVLATGALGRSLATGLVAPAFGVLEASMVSAMVVGALVAPLLTASFGLRTSLAVAGLATPLLAIGALHVLAKHDRGAPR